MKYTKMMMEMKIFEAVELVEGGLKHLSPLVISGIVFFYD